MRVIGLSALRLSKVVDEDNDDDVHYYYLIFLFDSP